MIFNVRNGDELCLWKSKMNRWAPCGRCLSAKRAIVVDFFLWIQSYLIKQKKKYIQNSLSTEFTSHLLEDEFWEKKDLTLTQPRAAEIWFVCLIFLRRGFPSSTVLPLPDCWDGCKMFPAYPDTLCRYAPNGCVNDITKLMNRRKVGI